jgi:uncharacterized membrane protein HdeD (DUF308 family)
MRTAHSGKGLIVAGLVVSMIGLGIVLFRVLQIPGFWAPLMVGVALLLAGVLRRGHS